MILFYILIFLSAVPNHPIVEYPIAGLTVIKYLGILCALYAVIYLVSKGSMPSFVATGQARSFLLLFCVAAASFALQPHAAGFSSNSMLLYISILAAFFVTLALIDSIVRFHRFLLAAIGSIAFAGLYVVREWQKSNGEDLRPGWIAGDSNYFALCALLVIPFAFYLCQRKGPAWEKWFCIGSLLVIVPAFTLASSRGGFVGLCVAFAYSVFRSNVGRRRLIWGGLAFAVIMIVAPSSPIKRFMNPGTGDIEAVDIRKTFWNAGWQMIQQHPLSGVGLGMFASKLDDYAGADLAARGMACNTYLEYAAELGIGGLVAYLLILYFSFAAAEKMRKVAIAEKDSFLNCAALGTQAGLLGYAASGFFVSAEYQKLFWLVIFVTCSFPQFAAACRAKHARKTDPGEQIANSSRPSDFEIARGKPHWEIA